MQGITKKEKKWEEWGGGVVWGDEAATPSELNITFESCKVWQVGQMCLQMSFQLAIEEGAKSCGNIVFQCIWRVHVWGRDREREIEKERGRYRGSVFCVSRFAF